MSEPGPPEYKVGDVVGGYVLTESGWQPVASGQPVGGYRIGDQANGYVLTETGWQPLPAAQPTQEYVAQPTQEYAGQPAQEYAAQPTQAYQVGDVAGGYILTESGWVPVPGAQGGPVEQAQSGGPYGGGPVRPASSNKVLYWILGGAAAVVLLVVIGVVIAVRSSDSGPTTSSSTATASRTTTRSPSPTTSATASVQNFAFGQTGTLTQRAGRTSGEVKIDAPVPFAPTNQFDKPERGQFVYVVVTLTATGSEPLPVSKSDFTVVLPDGQRLRSAFIADPPNSAPAELTSANLNAGEKVTGSVVFDVPPNTPLKIAYTPLGQITGIWG